MVEISCKFEFIVNQLKSIRLNTRWQQSVSFFCTEILRVTTDSVQVTYIPDVLSVMPGVFLKLSSSSWGTVT